MSERPFGSRLADVLTLLEFAVGAARGEGSDAKTHPDLTQVIHALPVPLLIVNRDRTIRLQNQAAIDLLGELSVPVDAREVQLRSLQLTDAAQRPVTAEELPWTRALHGEDVAGQELHLRKPDGHAAVAIVSAVPLRDAHGGVSCVATVFQDVTRGRELDRMKDEFVSIASHELRTPLTAIRGSLQLLLADEGAIPDAENRELLRVALRSCERLVRIVNDMLDISKLEAGKLRLTRRRVPVIDIVRHSLEEVRPVADAAGVTLMTQVSALPDVDADADRLTQALVNLLSNAVKFAPQKSDVIVAAREDGDAVVISVADEGAGIHPDDVPGLFQKFHQLERSGTRRTGGTGLGLAITRAIVEEHGGTVAVESHVGRGTTFSIRVPKARDRRSARRAARTEPTAAN